MGAAHTPGPWKAVKTSGSWEVRCDAHDDLPIAQLWKTAAVGMSHEANARLMAAAPTTLDALKALHDKTAELISHLRATDRLRPCFNLPALEQARAAIAKATGESA